ncbi:hypothetical protein GWI33_006919 [Rhynchophorus ferrugineus]|uniref:Uncharacterized protein n=1 Tax=Rhynchophorus ferrugineus TaxID=354439 RepID=A0A834ISF4_RHYFE|nr:hypothetical protein GWI33_006919 [Rhynchophorus ferrugineus]
MPKTIDIKGHKLIAGLIGYFEKERDNGSPFVPVYFVTEQEENIPVQPSILINENKKNLTYLNKLSRKFYYRLRDRVIQYYNFQIFKHCPTDHMFASVCLKCVDMQITMTPQTTQNKQKLLS